MFSKTAFVRNLTVRCFVLVLGVAALTSCRRTEESAALLSKATDVYWSSDVDWETRADSSLRLTNRALELDPENWQALVHRGVIYFDQRDLSGLLRNADALIAASPDPMFIAQKGLILELSGDTGSANRSYDLAIRECQDRFNKDSSDFGLRLNYVHLLQLVGDTLEARDHLGRMAHMDLDDQEEQILTMVVLDSNPKQGIREAWNAPRQ